MVPDQEPKRIGSFFELFNGLFLTEGPFHEGSKEHEVIMTHLFVHFLSFFLADIDYYVRIIVVIIFLVFLFDGFKHIFDS